MKKNKKISFWQIIKTIIFFVVLVFSFLIILSSLKINGYRMFVVKSGSMEPKIKQGSVIFDKEDKDYVVGDVVTFRISNNKDTVTHRIVEAKIENGSRFYKVKGDANTAPDTDKVYPTDIVGKMSFSVPYLGYLVAFVKTLPGLIILIIIPATIIIYEEIGKIKEEIIRIQEAKKAKNPTGKVKENLNKRIKDIKNKNAIDLRSKKKEI